MVPIAIRVDKRYEISIPTEVWHALAVAYIGSTVAYLKRRCPSHARYNKVAVEEGLRMARDGHCLPDPQAKLCCVAIVDNKERETAGSSIAPSVGRGRAELNAIAGLVHLQSVGRDLPD
jgi:hypothetical protein